MANNFTFTEIGNDYYEKVNALFEDTSASKKKNAYELQTIMNTALSFCADLSMLAEARVNSVKEQAIDRATKSAYTMMYLLNAAAKEKLFATKKATALYKYTNDIKNSLVELRARFQTEVAAPRQTIRVTLPAGIIAQPATVADGADPSGLDDTVAE